MKTLLAVASVLCASAAAQTYPLFSWTSTKDAFKNFEPKSAHHLIESKHKSFKTSVIYLHSLSTEQLGMHKDATSNMQDSITKSGSSIFRPMQDSSVDPEHLVAPYSGHVVQASDALSFLKNRPEMPQVMVVDMRSMESSPSQLAEADKLRSQVDQTVSVATGNNYLSVLASTQPAAGRKLLWVDTHQTATVGNTPVWEFFPRPTGNVHYLTPNSLLGIGVTLYLFFIAICGYCCLFSLQTPDVFQGDQKEEMDRALGKNTK